MSPFAPPLLALGFVLACASGFAIPERATAVDPEPKPPEGHAVGTPVDGAGSSSEAAPAERGGGPATSRSRMPGDTGKAGRAGEGGGNPPPIHIAAASDWALVAPSDPSLPPICAKSRASCEDAIPTTRWDGRNDSRNPVVNPVSPAYSLCRIAPNCFTPESEQIAGRQR